MGTFRALKIVYRQNFDHDRPFEREFKGIEKFEPISRSHEGLVDILQIGRNDQAGHFYYVMELADALPTARNQCSVISNQSQDPTLRETATASLNTDHCLLIPDYSPRT